MAGIIHRTQFPVGSSPDSIQWDIWNDSHGFDDGAGGVLTFGAIADGEFLKRDGATIVGAAGGGGSSSILMFIVTYAEFVDIGGGVAVIDPFYTVPAGAFITGTGIVVIEATDDSGGGGMPIDITEKLSDTSIGDADFRVLGGGSGIAATKGNLQGTGGGASLGIVFDRDYLVIAHPIAAELIMKMPSYAGDGTQGIAHIYLQIETPVLTAWPI